MRTSNTIKRSFSALTVTAVLGTATLLSAPAASAAAGHCPSGAACIWEDAGWVTNGVGRNYVAFQRKIPDYSLWHYNSTNISANDSASSLYNNGNLKAVRFYVDKNKGGDSVCFPKQQGSDNLTRNAVNDQLSSGYFNGF